MSTPYVFMSPRQCIELDWVVRSQNYGLTVLADMKVILYSLTWLYLLLSIYSSWYIYVVFMCWCHCISVVRATRKFLIYQRIFFPMSRILHIAPISASFDTYFFVVVVMKIIIISQTIFQKWVKKVAVCTSILSWNDVRTWNKTKTKNKKQKKAAKRREC